VRVKLSGAGLLVLGAILVICGVGTWAKAPVAEQNPDAMMPEQNAAKAREILNQLVEALGGPAYLEVRERECDGRRAQFGHNGELDGFIEFKDYWRYPDKHRVDYSKKRNIIDLFNGDHGWSMDRGGVSDEPEKAVSDFQQMVKFSVDNLLRNRLKDPSLNVLYAGRGISDMRPIDWLEITEGDRTLRLGIDRTSHLLLRSVIISIDEETRERTEETTLYTNYQRKDSVLVPLQVSRERDGHRFFQAFYENCTFHPNFPEDMFSKSGLEKRYAEVGNKKDREKYKNARD
jgi:hypothetical protein